MVQQHVRKAISVLVIALSVLKTGTSEAGSCQALPLNPRETKEWGSFFDGLDRFEKAFQNNNSALFTEVVHPSILKNGQKKEEVFNGTVENFGLKGVKIARSQIAEVRFDPPSSSSATAPEQPCHGGVLRGVNSHLHQISTFHTITGGNEILKMHTLWMPVLRFEGGKSSETGAWGVVMLFVQAWTHAGKSPEAMRTEARKWSNLGDPLTAWMLAEGARRLVRANPYFDPGDMLETESFAEELKKKRGGMEELQKRLDPLKIGWTAVDWTVVYKAESLEPGVRFRFKDDDNFDHYVAHCKQSLRALAPVLKPLGRFFSGVECMAWPEGYAMDEKAPNGSVFMDWPELLQEMTPSK